MRCPVDLTLAQGGYLRSPDGHVRYLCELDRLTRDLMGAGVRLYWDTCLPVSALCCCWSRVVLLSPAIAEQEPWQIYGALTHELGHALRGPSDRAVWRWQWRLYREMVQPPEWV